MGGGGWGVEGGGVGMVEEDKGWKAVEEAEVGGGRGQRFVTYIITFC